MTATVTLKITSDTSTLRADIGKTKQSVESLAPAAQQAGNAATQSFEKVSNAAKKTADSTSALTRGFSEFKQLFAGLGTVALVKRLTSMADEYANISAKLKLVTSGTDQFNAAQNRVFEIAQRTSSGLNETATLATKVTRIFLGMGESNESALNKGLKLTETLQKALAVSNATVSEANSLVLQLGQALQSGVLQGDEFRSVMENGGRVIQALTEYTGKSVAELRKMAEQGQLTAATVTNALSAATGKIDKEFSKIPLTIERAFTQLRNSILQYIGQADQASGTSRGIAESIKLIANNVGTIISSLVLLGETAAVVYGIRLIGAGQAFIANLALQQGALVATINSMTMLQKAASLVGAAFVGWEIGKYLRENFLEAQLAGIAMVNGLLIGWERVKQGAAILWEAVKASFQGAINFIREGIATLFDSLAAKAEYVPDFLGGSKAVSGLKQLADAVRPVTSAYDEFTVAAVKINSETDQSIAKINAITGDMADYAIQQSLAASKSKELAKATNSSSKELSENTKLTKEALKHQKELAEAQFNAAKFLSKLRGDTGEVSKVYQTHVTNLVDASKIYDELIAKGEPLANAQKFIAEATKLSTEATEKNIAALKQQADVVGIMLAKIEDDRALEGLSGKELAVAEAVRQARDSYAKLNVEVQKLNPLTEQRLEQLKQATAAQYDHDQAVRESIEIQREYQGMVQNGLTDMARSIADFATGSIKKWSDFGKSLKDTAKQFIADIIQQFLKLKFVNPIMNSLFKVGLPTMASGGALAGNGSAGGLTGGISGLSNLIGGSGGLISAIAGLTAGIGAFKSSGGGAGGLIGGAATGIGTYFAGSALTAGAGALGAGAGIAGAATAAIGAIPVAGWVALGAMAVNKLTGGGLFGTKYKATGASNTTFDLSGGVSTQIEESKKKAFFGGTKTRYVAGQVDPEAQKAFNDFLTGLKEIGTQASQALGTTAVDIITGSFKQVVDKKGNLKDQFSTVLGKIYKESFEDFQKRAKAETIVAQVQQVAPGANSIVDSFRGNASKLLDVAQLMLAAQVDMTKGNALLSDSLADTVTFVNAHAEANETLTQTYARLQGATALLQQATDLMGINLGKSKEEFITFAADIAKAAGGLDQATQLWNGFFQNFYTETEALAVQLPKLIENAAKELADIGLDSSTTKDQLKQQFNDLLPTLSPEQVVQWLEAANALNAATVAQEQYNQSIGNTTETIVQSTGELLKAQTDYFKMVNGLQQELGGGSAFAAQVSDIRAWEAETVDAMNKAAIAAGMQGAAEQDLALVHTVAQQRISAAAQQLLNETKSLIDQLYGSGSGFSQSPVETFSTGASSGLSDVSSSLDDVFEKWQRGLKGVKEFLDKILLDKKLTTLTPEQQLNEAQKQFQDALKLAKGGDAEALAKLPDMANTLLTIGRDFFSSGDQYTALFNGVRDALKSLPENSPLAASPGSPSGSVGGNTFSTYLDQRDAKVAEQEAAHRAELAQQLAQHLRDLSEALNKPILELMESMGVNLNMLAADLGINLQNITGESVKQLADLAQTLGLRLGELTTGLGLTLTDLGGGITELTTQLGIDFNNLTGQQVTAIAQLANDLGLSLTEITTATGHQLTDLSTGVTQLTDSLGINLNNLTVESTNQLAQLAQRLGADLSELSQSVGVDLGSLADSQSLLNQSLSSTIETLPKGQRDQLEPLLNAITSATSEADANAAIKALEEATKGLPAEQRDQLAPYFEGIFPASASTQLDYLSGIYQYARDQLDAINKTNDLIIQLGASQDLPGFAVGTSYVPKDMMANIHKGEMVIDPETSDFLRNYGIQVKQVPVAIKPSSDESAGMLNALREVNARLKAIEEGQSKDTNTTVTKMDKLIAGFDNMTNATKDNARAIDRQTDRLVKR